MSAPRTSVVLPVYNEADNIATCLRGLGQALADEDHEILVVYDFDEDTTLPAIEAMSDCPPSVRLVKNEIGRGAANALRAGFRAARGEAVVTTMADLSDPPELIPVMARAIRAGADVVSGSRYMAGGSQTGGPLLKRCMSQTASLMLNGIAGMSTLDATSNFRGYSKRFLSEVEIESDAGFEIALELTVKAHLSGRQVSEVPSSWTDRTAGESQFQLWKWLPNYLRWFRRAMIVPAWAWGLWLVGIVVAALTASSPVTSVAPDVRAPALFLVALFAAGSAGALLVARNLRGRTSWPDLLHPALWMATPSLGLATQSPLAALAACALVSLIAIAFGVGWERFAPAARATANRIADQRTLGIVLLGLVFWLTRVSWPMSTAGPALDASWEQGIGYALKNRIQWGDDIVFTFGPLGYFNRGRFDPDLYWTKLLWWDIVFKGWLTVFLVAGVLRLKGPLLRTLAVLVFLLPMQGHDAYFFLSIVAISAWLLERTERPLISTLPAVVPLSWIALIKFTPLVLSVAAVGAVAVAYARRRSLASAVGMTLLFGGSLCATWVGIGQSLWNLPGYLTSSATISRGYSEAMTVSGPLFEVQLALGIAALAAVVGLLAALEKPRRFERLVLTAILAAGLFLAGKAGFVRHGNNAITFFGFAACVTFLIPARDEQRSILRRTRLTLSALCAVLGIYGYHVALEHGEHAPHRLAGDWVARVSNNVRVLADFEGREHALAEEREEIRQTNGLPRIRERIGDATVDLLHSRQGALLLSGLNWHPRPAFQGYYSYTPELIEMNRAFLESDEAPDYLVFRSETLDRRFPNMDDNQALLVMMRDYRPIMTEKDYLLLERRPDAPRPMQETVIDERTLAFDETYTLPELSDNVHLLKVDVEPTLFGKLGTTLAKAPQVDIFVHRVRQERFKLVPGMAHTGLIVKPFAVGQEAWLHWFSGGSEHPIEAVRINVDDRARSWFRYQIRVRLVRVEGITPEAGDLRMQLDFSSFPSTPAAVRTEHPIRRRTLRGKELVVVNAPSELRFELPAGVHSLTGGFGLEPKSYRKEPRTDGAGFAAILIDADGNESELWSRVLDPVNEIKDCRMQPLELTIDTASTSTLCLRTDPGPSGDASQDQAFWHRIEIVGAGQ